MAGMKVITDERCVNYSQAGHPERPARVSSTLERLRGQEELKIEWAKPLPVEDEVILRAHTREHLKRVESAEFFDGDTPAYSEIADHAKRSIGGALHALQAAKNGETAFSLMRPPGHHSTSDRVMGFCYLNSVAIAAFEALNAGATKVAVYDFDVHHGNGTEAILKDQPHTAFFSIHQHPWYPGTGATDVGDNCHNYPVPARLPKEEYRKVMLKALNELKEFKPDIVAVSAGFDCYKRDPLGQMTFEVEDFHWLGKQVRELGVPAFSLLEGGYSTQLPELIFAYLKGLAGK